MPRTTILGVYGHGTFGALERVNHHTNKRDGKAPLEIFWRIVAKQSILAAGVLERPIAFRDNDRPGKMNAGAVRSYLNRWDVAPGKVITVFANNDATHQTALDFQACGLHVAAVIDSRTDATALGDYRFIRGAQVSGTGGRKGLESITVWTASGSDSIATDCLAMSGGWNPTVHLTCHMNGRPTWREDIASFVPSEQMIPNMITAGACNGTFSTQACLRPGIGAADKSIAALGKTAQEITLPHAEDTSYKMEPLWAVPGKGRAWLGFQNDVSVKDVKQAAAFLKRARRRSAPLTFLSQSRLSGQVLRVRGLLPNAKLPAMLQLLRWVRQ